MCVSAGPAASRTGAAVSPLCERVGDDKKLLLPVCPRVLSSRELLLPACLRVLSSRTRRAMVLRVTPSCRLLTSLAPGWRSALAWPSSPSGVWMVSDEEEAAAAGACEWWW